LTPRRSTTYINSEQLLIANNFPPAVVKKVSATVSPNDTITSTIYQQLLILYIMHMKIGTVQLHVKYTDEQLASLIDQRIDAAPSGEGTGFKEIVTFILEQANADKMFDTVDGTSFQWMELVRPDIRRVNAIIAIELREGRLMVDFDTDHYATHDVYFIRP